MAETRKPLEGQVSSASVPRAEETPPDAAMTQEHCRLLRLHRAALVDRMSPGHVLPVLVSLGVIGRETQEEIVGGSGDTRQEINERLLNVLPTKGERGYHAICRGLREGSKQGNLAGLLDGLPDAISRSPAKGDLRHDLGDSLQPRTKDELITRLETQLRHTRQSLEALQQSRIQAAQEGDHTDKLQTAEAQLQAMQGKLEALENKLSQREREKKELHSRHANLKENFKKYREGKELTMETLKKEHRQSSLLKNKCNQQKQEIAHLKTKVSDLERALRKANKTREGKIRQRKMETKATMTERDQEQHETPRQEKENFLLEVQRQQRASLQRIHLRHDQRDVAAAGDSFPAARRQSENEDRIKQVAARRRQVQDEENRQAALLRQRQDRTVVRRFGTEDTRVEQQYRRDTAASRNKFEAFLNQSKS